MEVLKKLISNTYAFGRHRGKVLEKALRDVPTDGHDKIIERFHIELNDARDISVGTASQWFEANLSKLVTDLKNAETIRIHEEKNKQAVDDFMSTVPIVPTIDKEILNQLNSSTLNYQSFVSHFRYRSIQAGLQQKQSQWKELNDNFNQLEELVKAPKTMRESLHKEYQDHVDTFGITEAKEEITESLDDYLTEFNKFKSTLSQQMSSIENAMQEVKIMRNMV